MAIPTQEEAPGGSKGGEEEAIHGGRITYYLCDSWNPQTQESIIDIAYTSWSILGMRQDVVNQFWAALIKCKIATRWGHGTSGCCVIGRDGVGGRRCEAGGA